MKDVAEGEGEQRERQGQSDRQMKKNKTEYEGKEGVHCNSISRNNENSPKVFGEIQHCFSSAVTTRKLQPLCPALTLSFHLSVAVCMAASEIFYSTTTRAAPAQLASLPADLRQPGISFY